MKIEKTAAFIKATVLLHALLGDAVMWPAPAVSGWEEHGGRNIAVGNAVTALQNNPWSMFTNPAGAPRRERIAGLFASPQPFGLNELALGSAVYQEPFAFGTVGCGAYAQGFDLYHENGAAIAIASELADSAVQWGVSCMYTGLSISGYGSAGAVQVGVGILARIADGVTLGASVGNLNQARIGDRVKERLPVTFALGVVCRPTATLLLSMDAYKDLRYPVDIRCGVEFLPVEYLAFRVGSSTEPARFACGIGIRVAGISLDYASRFHPELGSTHSLSVLFSLGDR